MDTDNLDYISQDQLYDDLYDNIPGTPTDSWNGDKDDLEEQLQQLEQEANATQSEQFDFGFSISQDNTALLSQLTEKFSSNDNDVPQKGILNSDDKFSSKKSQNKNRDSPASDTSEQVNDELRTTHMDEIQDDVSMHMELSSVASSYGIQSDVRRALEIEQLSPHKVSQGQRNVQEKNRKPTARVYDDLEEYDALEEQQAAYDELDMESIHDLPSPPRPIREPKPDIPGKTLVNKVEEPLKPQSKSDEVISQNTTHDVLSNRPTWGPDCSMEVTLPDGRRFFAQMKQQLKDDTFLEDEIVPTEQTTNFKRICIPDMLTRIQEQKDKQLAITIAREQDNQTKTTPEIVSDVVVRAPAMWVDKYVPKSFLHLLSDDTINRCVLQWVKMWDKRVFHKKASSKNRMSDIFKSPAASANSEKSETTSAKSTRQNGQSGSFQKAKSIPFDFPKRWNTDARILLFAGPPGAGKTTLAHIVAKTAGYQPMEINASDDRSATKIRERLVDAMQMRTVWGSQKPVLLILDEIDGIEGGAKGGIAEVVKMIKATNSLLADWGDSSLQSTKAQVASDKTESNKKKKKSTGPQALTRPLICICNDLYAPALRELRREAQVVEFTAPEQHRLVERLQQICRYENLNPTEDALYELATQTDNDIRSCLHTLQFMQQKSDASRITADSISRFRIGHKDVKSGMFQAWDAIFSKGRMRNNQQLRRRILSASESQGVTSTIPNRYRENYEDLYATLSNLSTDVRLLLDGLHENYLRAKMHDPGLHKIMATMEWFCYGAQCAHRATSQQQFFMYKYLPNVGVAAAHLCRSELKFRVQFPRDGRTASLKHEQKKSILNSFLQGKFPMAGARDGRAAVLDLIPAFITIVNPPLRPVNFRLYNSTEKTQAKDLVDVLVTYGATFAAHSTPQPSGTFKEEDEFASYFELRPEVTKLVEFHGMDPFATRTRLPDILREIIAREVKISLLKRADSLEKDREAQEQLTNQEQSQTASEKPAVGALPAHVIDQIRKGQAARTKKTVPYDSGPSMAQNGHSIFSPTPTKRQRNDETLKTRADTHIENKTQKFVSPAGKAVSVHQWAGGHAGGTKRTRTSSKFTRPRSRFPVYFRFQEGFTDAVRRSVPMSDFL